MKFAKIFRWAPILLLLGGSGAALADPTPPPMLDVKQVTNLSLDTVREATASAVQFRSESAGGELLLGRVYDNANVFSDGAELSADAKQIRIRVLENDSPPSIGAGDRMVVSYVDSAGNPQTVYLHFPATTTAPATWYIGATGQLFNDYPPTTGAGEAPSPAPSKTPSPTPSPSPTPTPTPSPSPTPSPTATPSPEPSASPTPTPSPSPTPEPSASPTPTPSPSPSPSPSPAPVFPKKGFGMWMFN